MDLTLNGQRIYCYTGGRPLRPGQPTVVFLHGVLHAHCVWILQSRWFAHHGWNVLAPDLPGHLRSSGPSPERVEDGAEFVRGLLDVAQVEQAALVGHSWGSLIALEAAARQTGRISHLALVGTAYPMKVAPALLASSRETPQRAIEQVTQWSHALQAPPPSVLGPGTWVPGTSRALMRRVLASDPTGQVFYRGFKACDDYRGGEAAMARVQCPTLFLLGQRDAMTPPSAAAPLQALARQGRTRTLPCGHNLMAEDPEGVLAALRELMQA